MHPEKLGNNTEGIIYSYYPGRMGLEMGLGEIEIFSFYFLLFFS